MPDWQTDNRIALHRLTDTGPGQALALARVAQEVRATAIELGMAVGDGLPEAVEVPGRFLAWKCLGVTFSAADFAGDRCGLLVIRQRMREAVEPAKSVAKAAIVLNPEHMRRLMAGHVLKFHHPDIGPRRVRVRFAVGGK